MPLPIIILLIIIFSFLAFFISYFYGSTISKKKYGELSELELRIVDAKRRLESSRKEVGVCVWYFLALHTFLYRMKAPNFFCNP